MFDVTTYIVCAVDVSCTRFGYFELFWVRFYLEYREWETFIGV